jgi:hypothetical protein
MLTTTAGCNDAPKKGEYWEYNFQGSDHQYRLELVWSQSGDHCSYQQDGKEVVSCKTIADHRTSPESVHWTSPKLLHVADQGLAFIDMQGGLHFGGKLVPGVMGGFALSRDVNTPSGVRADGSKDYSSNVLVATRELPTYIVVPHTYMRGDPYKAVGWGTDISAKLYHDIPYLGLAGGIKDSGLPVWIGMALNVSKTESETTRRQSFEIGAFGRSPTPLDCNAFKDAPIENRGNDLNYMQLELMARDQEGGNTYSVMSRPGVVSVCGGYRLVYAASRNTCANDEAGNRVCTERFVMRIGASEFPIASPAKS